MAIGIFCFKYFFYVINFFFLMGCWNMILLLKILRIMVLFGIIFCISICLDSLLRIFFWMICFSGWVLNLGWYFLLVSYFFVLFVMVSCICCLARLVCSFFSCRLIICLILVWESGWNMIVLLIWFRNFGCMFCLSNLKICFWVFLIISFLFLGIIFVKFLWMILEFILEVMMMMVFLKFVMWLLLFVRWLFLSICRRILKVFGWVFLILFSRIML